MSKKLTYRRLEELLKSMPEEQKDKKVVIIRTDVPGLFLEAEILKEDLYVDTDADPGALIPESHLIQEYLTDEEYQELGEEIKANGPAYKKGDVLLSEWEGPDA